MCPASPQSITRFAKLIPAPAIFACSFKSMISLTGPLWIPILLEARMTLQRLADFHCAQHRRFRMVQKTSAPPSPVGNRSKLPSASARRNCSVPRTIWFNFFNLPRLLVDRAVSSNRRCR